MTTENDFLWFADGSSANVQPQTIWAAEGAITNGFPSGILASLDLNKALRQATAGMALLGAFMAAQSQPAVDNGNISTLLTNFEAALTAFIGTAGFSYNFATNGHVLFPGGFLINWGTVNVGAETSVAVTFDRAYTTALYNAGSTINSIATTGSGNYSTYVYTGAGSLTSMQVLNDANCTSPGAQNIFWFALGK